MNLLERLELVRPAGDGRWSARCPAHEDRLASLSIARGYDDRWLCHCHAGCTPADIVAALELDLSDLFADRPPEPSRPGHVRMPQDTPMPLPRAQIAAPAVDERDTARWCQRLCDDEAVLARIQMRKGWTAGTLARLGIGFDGRRLTFPVRAPGGLLLGVMRYLPGGEPKMLASRGAPRELWPCPEVTPGRVLFVVEGEPDAVSGFELDLPTVALPGAGKWRSEWVDRLAGRILVVIADCDEPGRTAAERLRAELGEAADVRVIDLDPGRGDGYDLGDELSALGHDAVGRGRLRRRLLALARVSDEALDPLPVFVGRRGLRCA